MNQATTILTRADWIDPYGLIKCTGTTQGGQRRLSKQWRARHGPASMREHHLVPQAMMKDPAFMNQMGAAGIKNPTDFIHRQIAIVPNTEHADVHADGWNNEFKAWFCANPNFTKKDLQDQIKKMTIKFNIPKGSRNFAGRYGG